MEMVNGYVFLDLTKANVYAKALKVLGTDKPVVIKDGSGSPYFVDSLTLDGTNVVITKGGKTITIANDNTITNVGDIQNHLYALTIISGDYNISFIASEKRDNYTISDMSNLSENDTNFLKSLKDIIKYELGCLYGATSNSTPFETNMSGGYNDTLYLYINEYEFEIDLEEPTNQSDNGSLKFNFTQLF